MHHASASERLSSLVRTRADGAHDDAAAVLPARGILRVLVCRSTHTLGNTLLLTPLIQEIERDYPGAEIDLVTRSRAADVIFARRSRVRTIYRLPARPFWHPIRLFRMLRAMRAVRYDLVIDPSPRSGTGRWLLRLACGRYKLGFVQRGRVRALTHSAVPPDGTRHAAQLPVALLRMARGEPERNEYPTLDIRLSAGDRQAGVETLRQLIGSPAAGSERPIIGVFANATGNKILPTDWWLRFLAVLEAVRPDCAFVEIVPASGRSLLESHYPAYFSSDLGALAGVLSGLTLFISGDCGVMLLAVDSGAPTVGIFTTTDPDEWGPYGARNRIVDVHSMSPEAAAAQVLE
jgi:ADP-heptose:LPS heptosyltransferase